MPKKPIIAPRKPNPQTPIDTVAAQKFLDAGTGDTPEPHIAEVRPINPDKPKAESKNGNGKRVLTRIRDGRKVRQTTVYLEAALAKKLAYHCVDTELDQSQVVNEALQKYLESSP